MLEANTQYRSYRNAIWYTVTEHGILTLREELMNTLTGSDFGIALLEPVWAYVILSGFLFPGMIFSQQ